MLAGAAALIFFAITKNSRWLEWATDADSRFGDLYALAHVAHFRPAQPLPSGEFAQRDSIDLGATATGSEIIFWGDSFGFRDDGERPLWLQIGQRTDRRVFAIYSNHHPEIWSDPYPFFDKLGPAGPQNMVVFEMVERLIAGNFGEPFGVKSPAPLAKRKWPGAAFFRDTAIRHQRLFRHGFATVPLVTAWDSLVFAVTGRISQETPLYSRSPPFLFYRDEVDCYLTPHADEGIEKMADHVALLAKTLHDVYHRELLFVPIPNKITIYSSLATSQPYDQFLPRLCQAVRARGVPTVDLLPRYRAAPELLYWPTDTHWNSAGIRIAVDATLQAWPEQARP
ncbi:MAG: hypothetical protein M3Y86_06135 [Verrucomicrobiota bacterium]|nr:hypothetical protein [Verrucomicrobiota bacterium]